MRGREQSTSSPRARTHQKPHYRRRAVRTRPRRDTTRRPSTTGERHRCYATTVLIPTKQGQSCVPRENRKTKGRNETMHLSSTSTLEEKKEGKTTQSGDGEKDVSKNDIPCAPVCLSLSLTLCPYVLLATEGPAELSIRVSAASFSPSRQLRGGSKPASTTSSGLLRRGVRRGNRGRMMSVDA